VQFATSKGDFTVEVNKAWAPFGTERFYELVRKKYFDEARFYRVMPKFVAQFGIHRDPEVAKLWRQLKKVSRLFGFHEQKLPFVPTHQHVVSVSGRDVRFEID